MKSGTSERFLGFVTLQPFHARVGHCNDRQTFERL